MAHKVDLSDDAAWRLLALPGGPVFVAGILTLYFFALLQPDLRGRVRIGFGVAGAAGVGLGQHSDWSDAVALSADPLHAGICDEKNQ